MLGEKRFGLTVNLLATKVMPSLIPASVSPALDLDDVRRFHFFSTKLSSWRALCLGYFIIL